MELPFIKMHGLGNNYIYVDLFQFQIEEEILPDLARAVADVNTGIGADGLILIQPSKRAEVGMRIFNKDGSEGKTCGNGLRCTAKYAYEHGLVATEKFQIETKANLVAAEVEGESGRAEEITINMGAPMLERSAIPMLGEEKNRVVAEDFAVKDAQMKVTAVSMGNPHAVFFVDDIQQAPLYQLGPVIEKDARFPEGVNVEFVEAVSETELNFHVWERGSGVTQACGTGACAAAVAAVLNGYARQGETITVHLAGGDLMINWSEDGDVWMTGGAEVIAAGTFFYNGKARI
ncbi:diaminopimelate epimerase [Lentibacillus sediminis]|uniref:diaminopimelate epimerase n=1 Tax=Lentibacillus sediminis TaxID=1940529 RepID=UPI000C1C4154|nr:diaminopimelate epimerase [Lentibacillus sediminis]